MHARLKRYSRYGIVVLAVTVIAVLLQGPYERPLFVFNTSPSIPLGLYYRRRGHDGVRVGDVVMFAVPDGTAHEFVKSRLGRVRSNWTIFKPVAAAGGDHVCTRHGWLYINGVRTAPLVTTDSEGNPVPTWRGCKHLDDDQVFVVATRVERSFDSRVYGPVRQDEVVGVYEPLWVWD
jgi:conjugative transfer signal peptidase TraF